MATKYILFDLDGTLLPMDQDTFVKAYIGGLARAAEQYGYEPMTMTSSILAGTMAMIKNDGEKSNYAAFWDALVKTYGEEIRDRYDMFDEFYATAFQKVKEVCGFAPEAFEIVKHLKEKGFRVALATNPLFPIVATESRIRWAGLEPKDFELFTTYETSRYCKPNLDYYRDVLAQLGVTPEECLMVGNDVSEDMIASKLGMKVFLLTDCMINKKNADISVYPHGSFDELTAYIDEMSKEN